MSPNTIGLTVQTPPDIPADILRFISERIDSVPQLETLIMMSADPAQPWEAADVTTRVYVRPDYAREILDTLHRRGLIAPIPGTAAFHCAPVDPQDHALIAEVARVYRSNLISVATFIHAKGSAAVKEFARAFDLKKDR